VAGGAELPRHRDHKERRGSAGTTLSAKRNSMDLGGRPPRTGGNQRLTAFNLKDGSGPLGAGVPSIGLRGKVRAEVLWRPTPPRRTVQPRTVPVSAPEKEQVGCVSACDRFDVYRRRLNVRCVLDYFGVTLSLC
jgi:hypothetical protein